MVVARTEQIIQGGYQMVDQLPNRGLELEMLQAMGMSSMDDLFDDIPVV